MSQIETAIQAMATLGAVAGEQHLSKDTYKQIKSLGLSPFPGILYDEAYKIERGVYVWPSEEQLREGKKGQTARAPKPKTAEVEAVAAPQPSATVHHLTARKGATVANRFDKVIPELNPLYVKTGEAPLIEKIVRSKMWFPVIITGDSGFGKTMMIEQACARTRRELFRVNLNSQTDEGDLIGEKGLSEGSTFFEEGPVLAAMRRGAVLLLDELDYASPQAFTSIQSIMEGGEYLNKKTGERVVPAKGFTVIATMNTKGRGDASGRFVGAQLMNVAFLDRFTLAIEHSAPTPAIEKKMLGLRCSEAGLEGADETIEALVRWANQIRASFNNDSIEENMSTRRLGHIVDTMAMLGVDKVHRCVELCVNRYEATTAKAMYDLFAQILPQKSTPTAATTEDEE